MGNEVQPGQDPEHEGMRYLRLLGLEQLADRTIPGRTEHVRDFLDICGPEAKPMLVGLETLRNSDDPRFEPARTALREEVAQHLHISLES